VVLPLGVRRGANNSPQKIRLLRKFTRSLGPGLILWITDLKEDEMGRALAQMGETRNVYRILVRKPEGKRPLGSLRCRWVGNIKIDLREIGWDGMDWINLAQDREQWRALVNTVMNLRVP
jgi:hypothetical protein